MPIHLIFNVHYPKPNDVHSSFPNYILSKAGFLNLDITDIFHKTNLYWVGGTVLCIAGIFSTN